MKKFSEVMAAMPPSRRDEIKIEISRECNVALSTIDAWIRWNRMPRERSIEKIENILRIEKLIGDTETVSFEKEV
jgi:hypothetical protein